MLSALPPSGIFVLSSESLMHPIGDSGHANAVQLKSTVPEMPHAEPEGLCDKCRTEHATAREYVKKEDLHVECSCHIWYGLQPCTGMLTVQPFL